MAYSVQFSARAKREMLEAFDYIHGDSPDAAHRWLHVLDRSLDGLALNPEAFDAIPENESLSGLATYRSFNHFSHRVIYSIEGDQEVIRIHRVYHGARRPLTHRDIPQK